MICAYAWGKQDVIKTFSGFVSGRDFIQSAERVSADPRFDGLKVIYNDFTAVTGHSIDASAYQRVAACRIGAARSNPNFRVVFVASRPMLDELRDVIREADQSAAFHPWVCSTLAEGDQWFARQPALDLMRAPARVSLPPDA